MDRHTRKNLKTDKFAQEVSHTFQFVTEHSAEAKRYGAIGLAVVLLAAGIFYYVRHQATVRAEVLAHALRIDDATVGPNVQQANLHFDNDEEKAKARAKALTELTSKYHGSQEGAVAAFYLASDAADKGDLADAEKRYKELMDSAPTAYSSMARLSLAEVYIGEGKNAEAEKLLRDAIAHPTMTVSKEEATIALARFIAKTNPAEAKKMLEPLRTQRAAVSRRAVEVLGEISQNAQ